MLERHAPAVLAAAGALAFGCAALVLGQSNNWDLCNYHWYDGWAWLSGRGDADLAPAHLQTWFNPLLPAALYALLSSLPPAAGTFALGAVQGLNLALIYLVARALLAGRPAWLAVAAAVVGATGATQLGELGATFGDNLMTLPLLGAMALVVTGANTARIALAGLLAGLAVGVKLTVAPFAAGIVLALPLLAADRAQALRWFALAAAAAAVGFLAAAGFWMIELYQRYGNPLFPMFGSLFGGEYVPPANLRDTRFLPRTLAQWLFYPVAWARAPRTVSELWFLDLRIPFAFLALFALPWWYRRAAAPALRHVLVALGIGYAGWLVLFGYYRYLALIEMLAPALRVVALGALPWRRVAVTVVVLALVVVTTKVPDWGRLPQYGERYVEVTLPDVPLERATIVLPDDGALAFMIPSFPASAHFVRVGGNLMGPPMPTWALDGEAAVRIATTQGPLYALVGKADTGQADEALWRHNLAIDTATCHRVEANLLHGRPPASLCALVRAAE